MEPESFLSLQQSVTSPYPGPDESSPHPRTLQTYIIQLLCYLSICGMPGFPKLYLPFRFLTKMLNTFHSSPAHHISPDLITLIIIFREVHTF
jgi:hypothetical protein